MYWEKLEAIRDGDPVFLPGWRGRDAFSGLRWPLVFLVSEDHDGQVDLSLSIVGLRRPTDGHIRAFFRWLGVQPLNECAAAKGHTRHFILPGRVIH